MSIPKRCTHGIKVEIALGLAVAIFRSRGKGPPKKWEGLASQMLDWERADYCNSLMATCELEFACANIEAPAWTRMLLRAILVDS